MSIVCCRQYKLLLDKRTDSKRYKAIGTQEGSEEKGDMEHLG